LLECVSVRYIISLYYAPVARVIEAGTSYVKKGALYMLKYGKKGALYMLKYGNQKSMI